MDLQRVHDEFIINRRSIESSLLPGTFEVHHIKPRSLGGGEEKENKIRLVFSDHLFVHILLAKTLGGGMVTAMLFLLSQERYKGRSSRTMFNRLKSEHRDSLVGNSRGLGNKSRTGLKFSDETLSILGRGMTGNTRGVGNTNTLGWVPNDEWREKNRLRVKEYWSHPENRAAQSARLTGVKHNRRAV